MALSARGQTAGSSKEKVTEERWFSISSGVIALEQSVPEAPVSSEGKGVLDPVDISQEISSS